MKKYILFETFMHLKWLRRDAAWLPPRFAVHWTLARPHRPRIRKDHGRDDGFIAHIELNLLISGAPEIRLGGSQIAAKEGWAVSAPAEGLDGVVEGSGDRGALDRGHEGAPRSHPVWRRAVRPGGSRRT